MNPMTNEPQQTNETCEGIAGVTITPCPWPRPLPATTRRRRKQLVDELFASEVAQLVEVAIALARAGDAATLRWAIDRVSPPRRERAINIASLPPIESIADVPRVHAHLVALVGRGEITPGEASAVAAILDRYVGAVEATEHEERLADIEKRLGEFDATQQGC